MTTTTLGTRIHAARIEAGLTQVELSARVGVTQGLLSSYERGEKRPSVETLTALARALGCSADWLLGLATATEES